MEVAVVIPCFNEATDRIARTVDSALATSGVSRVVVVDDGSTTPWRAPLDARVEIVRRTENGGPSAALNAGIRELPTNAIVCRLDVGDAFYPDAKARQIAAVVAGIPCSSSPHHDPVAGLDWVIPPNWRRRIYTDSMFTGCTNVYHKSVWREVGRHDESLRYCADWDFNMKVQHHIGWHIHDEVTCSAGEFPGGYTSRSSRDRALSVRRSQDQVRVVKRGLEMKR